MLKRLQYPKKSPQKSGEVMYAIIENNVVFSGITLRGSTNNYAEAIITAISEEEAIDPIKYRWFDLQTHLGYSTKLPGSFDFKMLVLSIEEDSDDDLPEGAIVLGPAPGSIWVEEYISLSCPESIEGLFIDLIIGNNIPPMILTPTEAENAGYSPTETYFPTSGQCFQHINLHAKTIQLVEALEDVMVVVDHTGYPHYLERSNGNPYCVWVRQ